MGLETRRAPASLQPLSALAADQVLAVGPGIDSRARRGNGRDGSRPDLIPGPLVRGVCVPRPRPALFRVALSDRCRDARRAARLPTTSLPTGIPARVDPHRDRCRQPVVYAILVPGTMSAR